MPIPHLFGGIKLDVRPCTSYVFAHDVCLSIENACRIADKDRGHAAAAAVAA